MTHFARSPLAAFIVLAVSGAGFCESALAQTVMRPNVEGAVRENQTQPTPRPRREGVTGYGNQVQGVVGDPRFIVEALGFYAADESGRTDLASDEVFAVFESGRNVAVTEVFGSVDTGDRESFEAGQTCISPIGGNSRPGANTWACAPEGARGPVSFEISLYDLDVEVPQVFTGNFCIRTGQGFGRTPYCATNHSSLLFDANFSYGVSEILGRLDPACRCFEETASQSMDNARYEVTFRITRVDTGGEAPGVDRNAGAGPVVYRSGSLTAAASQTFEFDAGSVVGSGGDFRFVSSGGGVFTLQPNGGAKIWLGGATARGYATCYAQRMSANYVTSAINVPSAGSHACYVTSDGRVGELRITTLSPGMFGMGATLTLAYTTWQ
jgi:hypothetical protein